MGKRSKTKFITADDFIGRLPAERRAKIEARAAALIAEELTLRDLRKARDLTQVQLSAVLGVNQEHISRLEQRSDMLLSTLASYVRAMGGSLKFVAVFPDRAPVSLASLADVFETKPAKPAGAKKRKRSTNVAPA
jgi:DNA-binding XRE family transcriptional regulator